MIYKLKMLLIFQLGILKIIYQSYFLIMLLINCQSLPILHQLITNDLLIQFLCNYHAKFLPFICQSGSFFYYIDHIVSIATNYSNLLYQCFTNYYQSDSVLYITSLPIITNKLPIHYQSYHWYFPLH